MRTENVKVKITIPIPYERPDKNGVMYSKEAVEKAVNNLQMNLPIVYRGNESQVIVIGYTIGKPHIATWNVEKQVCNITTDGVVYYGGTECIVNEMEDGVVKDFSITGIGLSK